MVGLTFSEDHSGFCLEMGLQEHVEKQAAFSVSATVWVRDDGGLSKAEQGRRRQLNVMKTVETEPTGLADGSGFAGEEGQRPRA